MEAAVYAPRQRRRRLVPLQPRTAIVSVARTRTTCGWCGGEVARAVTVVVVVATVAAGWR